MNYKEVKFSKPKKAEFSQTVKKRVREYFKQNNISRYADYRMVIKTIAMLSLYFVPYLIAMSGVFTSPWAYFGLYLMMGIGIAGIGLSIMHDANHGAYSKNQKVNKFLGMMLDVVGGNAENWKIQHNKLHHTYTNITGLDEDIHPNDLLRFSPHEKLKKHHKYQHYYAWLLYGLMTLMWVVTKDFNQMKRYRDKGLISGKKDYSRLILEMAIAKIIYISYMIVLPLILLPIPWWMFLIFFVMMHYTAGLILGCVFQPAHVMEKCEYPLPDKEGMIDKDWNIHQMHTTTNFAPKNKILSWYVGGLNYQVEHHLFPNVCHVHYPAISKIVRQTAEEFNVPYYTRSTFMGALYDHAMMLRELGRK